MYPFVESLQFLDGKAANLPYHTRRLQETWKAHYGGDCPFSLETILKETQTGNGKWKVRFLYGPQGFDIEAVPYQARRIETLRLVVSDYADYPFKYTAKIFLEDLLKIKNGCDDILIVKNGLLTDTSFSNIALFDGSDWYTPDTYLLNGTRRQQLLDNGRMKTARLTPSDIGRFKTVSLINAMLDLGESVLPVSGIRY